MRVQLFGTLCLGMMFLFVSCKEQRGQYFGLNYTPRNDTLKLWYLLGQNVLQAPWSVYLDGYKIDEKKDEVILTYCVLSCTPEGYDVTGDGCGWVVLDRSKKCVKYTLNIWADSTNPFMCKY